MLIKIIQTKKNEKLSIINNAPRKFIKKTTSNVQHINANGGNLEMNNMCRL
jgi:hypothetical protein